MVKNLDRERSKLYLHLSTETKWTELPDNQNTKLNNAVNKYFDEYHEVSSKQSAAGLTLLVHYLDLWSSITWCGSDKNQPLLSRVTFSCFQTIFWIQWLIFINVKNSFILITRQFDRQILGLIDPSLKVIWMSSYLQQLVSSKNRIHWIFIYIF